VCGSGSRLNRVSGSGNNKHGRQTAHEDPVEGSHGALKKEVSEKILASTLIFPIFEIKKLHNVRFGSKKTEK
jgi:hypothetical protein